MIIVCGISFSKRYVLSLFCKLPCWILFSKPDLGSAEKTLSIILISSFFVIFPVAAMTKRSWVSQLFLYVFKSSAVMVVKVVSVPPLFKA